MQIGYDFKIDQSCWYGTFEEYLALIDRCVDEQHLSDGWPGFEDGYAKLNGRRYKILRLPCSLSY